MPLLSRSLAASNTSSSTIIASTASPRLVLRSSITSKPSITAPDFTPALTTKALSTLNPNKPNYPLPNCPRKQGNPSQQILTELRSADCSGRDGTSRTFLPLQLKLLPPSHN